MNDFEYKLDKAPPEKKLEAFKFFNFQDYAFSLK